MQMNFTLNLTGLEQSEKEDEEKAKLVLWKCMNKMEEIAKIKVPVDTGRLKNSIFLSPMQRGFRNYLLVAGTEYAIHVEWGTYKMLPQPYFRVALHQVQFYWLDIYKREVFGGA